MKNIISIIPARAGSKSIINKNIYEVANYPLIAYSIIASKLSKYISRTIVSTDSKEIANISLKYKAEIPFLRPIKLSQDNSTDLEWILHAIEWFNINEKDIPEYIVHLRPTTPLRDYNLIDKAIELFLNNKEATSLRSVQIIPESIYKCFEKEGNYLKGLIKNRTDEYYNLPRQNFPETYKPNGYIDIIKTSHILQNKNNLHGNKILAFITEQVIDIDTIEDINNLKLFLHYNGHYLLEKLSLLYKSSA